MQHSTTNTLEGLKIHLTIPEVCELMFNDEKCTKKNLINNDKEYKEIRHQRYRTFVYCIIICSLRSQQYIRRKKKIYKMLSGLVINVHGVSETIQISF